MYNAKILIIDDACFMRGLLGSTIRNIGYKSIYFADGANEAVEKCVRIKPDIVTLDISIPGVDGLEIIKRILEVSENSKIIMVSTPNTHGSIRQAMQYGAVDYIRKPYDKAEIEDKLNRYLTIYKKSP